jgi:hypothetical protein
MDIRITEERARHLLKQCKWLLLTCVAALAIFFALALGANGKMSSLDMLAFAIYGLAGVLYLILLGRLAYGLRRSVVYYVGGTLLLSSFLFLIAHVVAYMNIRTAVATGFQPKPTTAAAVA